MNNLRTYLINSVENAERCLEGLRQGLLDEERRIARLSATLAQFECPCGAGEEIHDVDSGKCEFCGRTYTVNHDNDTVSWIGEDV